MKEGRWGSRGRNSKKGERRAEERRG